jgi:FMN phosphatase YigB (HAD superfamily)
LLSNISEAHFNFATQTFPLLQLFDGAILSYQVRHTKPSLEIYHAVLKEAGCQPHECFYTDDILGHVQSARPLGIDSEQFLTTELLIDQLAKRMIFV